MKRHVYSHEVSINPDSKGQRRIASRLQACNHLLRRDNVRFRYLDADYEITISATDLK